MKTEGGGAVRHLQMSESEIVSSYRTARDPKRQIGILAELNAVTPREIREVLEAAGALMLKPRSHGGAGRLARFRLEPQLTGAHGTHRITVPRQNAVLAVIGGEHRRHALAPEEGYAGCQHIQLKCGCHHIPPFFISSALRFTSSMVPALKNAASG